jgi:hypothetical protein
MALKHLAAVGPEKNLFLAASATMESNNNPPTKNFLYPASIISCKALNMRSHTNTLPFFYFRI